jgi:hypothetical protein
MSLRTINFSVATVSQDADWNSRSTGPGVVWAHDFRDPSEVKAWRYTPNDSTAITRPDNGLDVQRVASSGIGAQGGMMVHTIRGTTLAQDINATATTIFLTSVAEMPDPATVGTTYVGASRYLALMGVGETSEEVIVTARNVSNNSLTVIRGGTPGPIADSVPLGRVAGDPFSVQDHTAWWRLMGAFGVYNGKTTPDIGIANGFKNFDTDWTTQGVNRNLGRFRGCYWGHFQYDALYDATWPVSGYDVASTNAGRVFHDTFVGNEFWLQWRAKVTGDRLANPNGKMCYLQAVTASLCQWFTNISPEDSPPANTYLHLVNNGQSGGATRDVLEEEGSTYPVRLNEWVTYMIHVRPGRYTVAESHVDLYVQEPGDTAWRHLYTTTTFPMQYDMPAPSELHPPAYNIFSVLNYANHYAGSGSSGASRSTHAVQATQVILSSQEIPLPLPLSAGT